jgi:hypothetical protein
MTFWHSIFRAFHSRSGPSQVHPARRSKEEENALAAGSGFVE